MSAPSPKYADVIAWLTASLDAVEGDNCRIEFNVKGSEVDANLVTNATGIDGEGRKIKTETRTTTRLRIIRDRRTAHMPLAMRRLR